MAEIFSKDLTEIKHLEVIQTSPTATTFETIKSNNEQMNFILEQSFFINFE